MGIYDLFFVDVFFRFNFDFEVFDLDICLMIDCGFQSFVIVNLDIGLF